MARWPRSRNSTAGPGPSHSRSSAQSRYRPHRHLLPCAPGCWRRRPRSRRYWTRWTAWWRVRRRADACPSASATCPQGSTKRSKRPRRLRPHPQKRCPCRSRFVRPRRMRMLRLAVSPQPRRRMRQTTRWCAFSLVFSPGFGGGRWTKASTLPLAGRSAKPWRSSKGRKLVCDRLKPPEDT